MYACILNAQGRYLHDVFLHKGITTHPSEATQEVPSASMKEVLLDVDAQGKSDFLRLLKRYRLRQKVDIDDVSSDYQVWTKFKQFDGNQSSLLLDSNEGSGSASHDSQWSGDMKPWYPDPRFRELGCRSILLHDDKENLSLSVDDIAPLHEYKKWRIHNGIAEGDEEIPSGEAIALEYNIDGLHGISFTKGCYVGQELMARTHFKGVVRKRLMPIYIEKGHVAQGDTIVGFADADDLSSRGKGFGSVRVVHGNEGLAVLRLKEGLDSVATKRTLRTSSGAEVRPWKPEWWPTEWGSEG